RVTMTLVATILIAVPVAAQDVMIPDVSEAAAVGIDSVERMIGAVESLDGIDDELRTAVLEQLRNAATQIQNRQAAEQAAAVYSDTLAAAPVEIDRLRALLGEEVQPPSAVDLGISDATTLEELTQLLSRELADQVTAESRVSELEARAEVQTGRPAIARTRIAELRSSGDDLAEVLEAPRSASEPKALWDARRLAAELQRMALAAEINKLEQELVSHPVRLTLLRARLEIAERSRLEANQRVEFVRDIVNEKRQEAADLAQRSAAEVEEEAAGKHPVIRALAIQNANLTRELPEIATKIDRATQRLESLRDEAENVELRLQRSQQRLEVAGLNRSLGLLMMEESRDLPQVAQYRSQIRSRSRELADIGLAEVRIREQRRELRSVDVRVETLATEIATDTTDEDELAGIRDELRTLLRAQRELLLQAENSYNSYLLLLGELDAAQRQLLETATEYRSFLNENMLWIPSAPVAFSGDWQLEEKEQSAALSVTPWLAVLDDFAESLAANWPMAVVVLLVLGGLLLARAPLSAYTRSANKRIGNISTDNIGLTIAALAAAGIRALPMPFVLAAVGWLLSVAPDPAAFSGVVSNSLFAVAPFLYNLLVFRVLAAEEGVLQVHFGWRQQNLRVIRMHLDRLVAFGAPIVFGTAVFYSSELAFDRATMGRFFFLALLILLVLTFRPLAHPKTGVAASYYQDNPDSWISKLRWFWYALSVGIPALLFVLSALGFMYTSITLTGRIVDTIWLALVLIGVNLVVLRWIAISRAKLALRVMEAEREKQSEPPPEGEAPSIETKPVDIDEVDAQTRKLLRWGLIIVAAIAGWGIWSEVFPAFRLFDQVSLWTRTVVVDGVETIAPVTLGDLMLALIVAAGTAIAYRNLPGLMEIAVLQRMTLEPGSRYTANTLVRYLVVTIGVIAVLNIIGWNWSRIQWLVAALSVGLGFGLQEVVANFVSGLIILFERPVRVGDTVTVGQLSGTVSRVRIRATTITDWDRKEIIVPNKAFITEQVVNWTLADPITRVVVEVGISYASDVERAHKIMEETLRSLPLVLDEPAPRVFFLGFGDSSLNFKLHAFSRQLSDRLPLMHAIHEAILKALRENDIEIPFPQRDLHIRSTVEDN
ncbi:MAG: mechanosensitive ion channel, partial [Woeseiaceae bacterium]|nr:mechanosensitive ion channel [Woeseiaceae bacterium]